MIFKYSKDGSWQRVDISIKVNWELLDFMKTHSPSFHEEAKGRYSDVVMSMTIVPLPIDMHSSGFEVHEYRITLSGIIKESKYGGFFESRYKFIMDRLYDMCNDMTSFVNRRERKGIVKYLYGHLADLFGEDLNKCCSVSCYDWEIPYDI